MRRRDMSVFLLSTGAGAALGAESMKPLEQSSNLPTPAEAASNVIPKSLSYPEGDVRRYGARQDSADNSAAFNLALLVSGHGGSAVLIPAGTWKITAPIQCVLGCSMSGVGQQSIIAPTACDAMTFTTQASYTGSRFFRDFQIVGTGTGAHTGICADMSAASHARITGIQFSNISIQNFGVGIFCRGVWNSSFRDCFLYNNFRGYHFHGQSVLINIDGGFVHCGSIDGSGKSYGILVDSIDGESCQSLHMNGVGLYAYDLNISLDLALYASIENCDVSEAKSIAIQLVTVHGGTTVRDCWIQTNGTGPTTGIHVADRASIEYDKIIIEGCTLICDRQHTGSVGIYVGSNQLGVISNGNSIGIASAAFDIGVRNGGAHNHVAKFNTIYAGGNAILINSAAAGVELGPNVVQHGAPLAFTDRTAPDFSYYASGVFTFELSGMVQKTRGNVAWSANGRTVLLSVADDGLTGVSGSETMTGIGLPLCLTPLSRRHATAHLIDNGAASLGGASIGADGQIVFAKDIHDKEFTGTGEKGLAGGSSITYNF